MKKLYKPACLLFYFLMLASFFLLGLLYASWIEAGKGQMLAGGAIVLGYGLLFAGIAFIASFFIVYYAKHRIIVVCNIVLAVFIMATILIFRSKSQNRKTKSEQEHLEKPKRPTAPVDNHEKILAIAEFSTTNEQSNQKMGIGFFNPNFYERPTLYFYGQPNLEKSVTEHFPTDSVVFKRFERGGFEIAQAPSWLVPEHLKLDYDMLYFEIKSMGREFAEVIVNKRSRRTAYVNKFDGQVVYWPEFLLSVHSVEFPLGSKQKVKARPFEDAGDISKPFSFLFPILIREEWMQVELFDDSLNSTGKGWVRWKKNGELLISYSLLS